jgi:hypothetical protein
MNDPQELAKELISGTISETAAKIVESRVARHLLDPAATEIGNLMGEIANAARFYATDNMGRIFKRWAEQRQGKPIHEEEFKRVLPLLPTASMVSDQELQKRWARLLQATATEEVNVMPSFGQTLSQMSAAEANYLDQLWREGPFGREKGELRAAYALTRRERTSGMSERLDKWYSWDEGSDEAELIISDLLRLGIFERVELTHRDIPAFDSTQPDRFAPALVRALSEEQIRFSNYGVKFMKATSQIEQ